MSNVISPYSSQAATARAGPHAPLGGVGFHFGLGAPLCAISERPYSEKAQFRLKALRLVGLWGMAETLHGMVDNTCMEW